MAIVTPFSPASLALRRVTYLANKSSPAVRAALQDVFARWARVATDKELLEVAGAANLQVAMNHFMTIGAMEGTPLRLEIGQAMATAGTSFLKDFAGIQFIGATASRIPMLALTTTTSEWRAAVEVQYTQAVATSILPIVESLRVVYHDGLLSGQGPVAFAREARDAIRTGLTAYDQKIMASYRTALETGDSAVLGRALRDKRFDRVFVKARDAGTGLSQAAIDQQMTAYERRLVAFRSETAARTVAVATANAGQYEAWRQFNAALGDGAMRYFWHYTAEGRRGPCPICQPIPSLNPAGVLLDEAFESPVGEFLRPPAHMACRCVLTAKVDLRAK